MKQQKDQIDHSAIQFKRIIWVFTQIQLQCHSQSKLIESDDIEQPSKTHIEQGKKRKLINLESGFPAQSRDSFVECFEDSSGKKLLRVDGTLLLSTVLINHGLCGLSPQNHRYRFLRRYLAVPQFLPLFRFPPLQLIQLPRYSPSPLVHHRQRRRRRRGFRVGSGRHLDPCWSGSTGGDWWREKRDAGCGGGEWCSCCHWVLVGLKPPYKPEISVCRNFVFVQICFIYASEYIYLLLW